MSRLWLGAAALAGFSAIVRSGALVEVDYAITDGLRPWHTPLADAAARLLTGLGDPQLIQMAVVIIAGSLWVRGAGRAAAGFGAAFLIGFLIEVALRLWVAQWRPDTNRIPTPGDWWIRFHLAGYPSGHAYHAAFLWGWLARRSRERWARTCCLAAIGLVGVTRVYLERHWLTDVLGSLLLASCVLPLAPGETRDRRQET